MAYRILSFPTTLSDFQSHLLQYNYASFSQLRFLVHLCSAYRPNKISPDAQRHVVTSATGERLVVINHVIHHVLFEFVPRLNKPLSQPIEPNQIQH